MSQQPAFDAWVQFTGHIRDPFAFPELGFPTKVFANSVYHMANKAAVVECANQELAGFAMQNGMLVLKPELLNKPMLVEYITNPEFKYFIPMAHIRFIETSIKPMTELPRIEEPGIPLTGQGVEIQEHKVS